MKEDKREEIAMTTDLSEARVQVRYVSLVVVLCL